MHENQDQGMLLGAKMIRKIAIGTQIHLHLHTRRGFSDRSRMHFSLLHGTNLNTLQSTNQSFLWVYLSSGVIGVPSASSYLEIMVFLSPISINIQTFNSLTHVNETFWWFLLVQ
jgi:hypothetical protein